MTDRYRMTTDVWAWRVQPDVHMPKEAIYPIQHRRGGWRHDVPGWVWSNDGVVQIARTGDWVVSHEYGCEAMTDEAFRACCVEVSE